MDLDITLYYRSDNYARAVREYIVERLVQDCEESLVNPDRYEKSEASLVMGRHREFDADEALDAALGVFWSKGYEGASYADLTQATGVERPALYSAFGNKENLFRRALELYYEHYLDFFAAALERPTSREVATYILKDTAELNARYPEPRDSGQGSQTVNTCSRAGFWVFTQVTPRGQHHASC